MEDSSCEITATALAERSAKYKARLDLEAEHEERKQVAAFLAKLKEFAKSASKNGKHDCSFSCPSTHRSAIDNLMRERGFVSRWDNYDGDTYITVSWHPQYKDS